jgi:D-arabinose 1-dehydrogenase-like Zn-dependent alcohol dehydrogenase
MSTAMPSMRAARFDGATRTLTVKDVPVPQPGPGEALVRIRACGICLSDVHLVDGSLPAVVPEVTPGHEAAGVIEKIGPGVPGWRAGQRVVMAGGRPCWQCRNCIRGRVNECLQLQIMGSFYDGAWAEYIGWAPTTRWTRVSGISARRCCAAPTGGASTWPSTWSAPTPCSPRPPAVRGGPAACS